MITIPKNVDSKYRFIILASARAKQLQAGAKPKIQTKKKNPAAIAIEEVAQGLVPFKIGEENR